MIYGSSYVCFVDCGHNPSKHDIDGRRSCSNTLSSAELCCYYISIKKRHAGKHATARTDAPPAAPLNVQVPTSYLIITSRENKYTRGAHSQGAARRHARSLPPGGASARHKRSRSVNKAGLERFRSVFLGGRNTACAMVA